MRVGRVTCTTTLVLEALREANDFRTAQELAVLTKRDCNQVWAALINLLHFRAVGVEVQQARRYWYALPPESDMRSVVRDEYLPHTKPKRRRGSQRPK